MDSNRSLAAPRFLLSRALLGQASSTRTFIARAPVGLRPQTCSIAVILLGVTAIVLLLLHRTNPAPRQVVSSAQPRVVGAVLSLPEQPGNDDSDIPDFITDPFKEDEPVEKAFGSSVAQITERIQWHAHPSYCLGRTQADKKYGQEVKLVDCFDAERFSISLKPNGGPIRPQNDPDMCLDRPHPHSPQLQFWPCSEITDANHKTFIVSPNNGGRIHITSSPERDDCLDAPHNHEGARLQIWMCNQKHRKGHFIFKMLGTTPDINCVWSEWGPWEEGCVRTRTMLHGGEVARGGLACLGPQTEIGTMDEQHFECRRPVLTDEMATMMQATLPTTTVPTLPPTNLPLAIAATTKPPCNNLFGLFCP